MKRILIADDDPDFTDSLRIILEALYEVRVEMDLDRLKEKIASFQPHLLFLDVMFPADGEAGIKMADSLRANAAFSNLKIVMLTAVSPEDNTGLQALLTRTPGPGARVVEALEKPLDPPRILKTTAALA